METKLCKKCNTEKPLSEMRGQKGSDGVYKYFHLCKECDNKRRKLLNRTKHGLINQMYTCSVRRSRHRAHNPPSYSREDLRIWVLNHINFDQLYNDWVKSEFNKMQTPSIDRLDEFKGYSFDNIRLVTWQDNVNAAAKNMIYDMGVREKCCKAVVKLTLSGDFVQEYFSVTEASRKNNVRQASISSAIDHRTVTANHAWAFAEDYNKNPLKYKVKICPAIRKICQLSISGELISIFDSIMEAMAQTGILNTGIGNVLSGRTKTAGGYKWIRLEDYNIKK